MDDNEFNQRLHKKRNTKSFLDADAWDNPDTKEAIKLHNEMLARQEAERIRMNPLRHGGKPRTDAEMRELAWAMLNQNKPKETKTKTTETNDRNDREPWGDVDYDPDQGSN